jgi:hypothetical protein
VTPSERLTQNGLFEKAALGAKAGNGTAEVVAVYEKIHAGMCVLHGKFLLTDEWQPSDSVRKVFKFRLELDKSELNLELDSTIAIEPTRFIPSAVKMEVWKRDVGKCVLCCSSDKLHCDHDLPYSKDGSSLTAKIFAFCVHGTISQKVTRSNRTNSSYRPS